MTSVVIMILITNMKQDCSYKGSAKVILYDPTSGTLLSESDAEERDFEEGRDRIKFEVGVGSHANIEQCQSKKLKLQVKVSKISRWCTHNTRSTVPTHRDS